MSGTHSLHQRLERLTPEQRAYVVCVLEGLEKGNVHGAHLSRQPGGLRGAMHTHDDFDAPLDEAFFQL